MNLRKKKIALLLIVVAGILFLTGCDNDDPTSSKTQFVTVMAGVVEEGAEKTTENILPTGVITLNGIKPEQKSEGMYKFRLKKNANYKATISDTEGKLAKKQVEFNSGNGNTVIYLTSKNLLNSLSINIVDQEGNKVINNDFAFKDSKIEFSQTNNGQYTAELKEGEKYTLINKENNYFNSVQKEIEYKEQKSIELKLERKKYPVELTILDENNNLFDTSVINNELFTKKSAGVFTAELKAGLTYDIEITDSANLIDPYIETLEIKGQPINENITINRKKIKSIVKAVNSEGTVDTGDFEFNILGANKFVLNNSEYQFELEQGKEYTVQIVDKNNYFETTTKTFTAGNETIKVELPRKKYTVTYRVVNGKGEPSSTAIINDDRFKQTNTGIFTANLTAGIDSYDLIISDSSGNYEPYTFSNDNINSNVNKTINMSKKIVNKTVEITTSKGSLNEGKFNFDIPESLSKEKIDETKYIFELEKGKEYTVEITDSEGYFETITKTFTADNENIEVELYRKVYTVTIETFNEKGEYIKSTEIDDPNFKSIGLGAFTAELSSEQKDYSIKITDTNNLYQDYIFKINNINNNINERVTMIKEQVTTTIKATTSEGSVNDGSLEINIAGANKYYVSDNEYKFDLEKGREYEVQILDNKGYFQNTTETFIANGSINTIELPRKEYVVTVEIVNSNGNYIENTKIADPKFINKKTGVYERTVKAGLNYSTNVIDENGVYLSNNIEINNIISNTNKQITMLKDQVVTIIKATTPEGNIDDGDFEFNIAGINKTRISNNKYSFKLEKDESYQLFINDKAGYFESVNKIINSKDNETIDVEIIRKTQKAKLQILNPEGNFESSIILSDSNFEKIGTGVYERTVKAGLQYSVFIEDQNNYFNNKTHIYKIKNEDYKENIKLDRQDIKVKIKAVNSEKEITNGNFTFETSELGQKINNTEYEYNLKKGKEYIIKISDSEGYFETTRKTFIADNENIKVELPRKIIKERINIRNSESTRPNKQIREPEIEVNDILINEINGEFIYEFKAGLSYKISYEDKTDYLKSVEKQVQFDSADDYHNITIDTEFKNVDLEITLSNESLAENYYKIEEPLIFEFKNSNIPIKILSIEENNYGKMTMTLIAKKIPVNKNYTIVGKNIYYKFDEKNINMNSQDIYSTGKTLTIYQQSEIEEIRKKIKVKIIDSETSSQLNFSNIPSKGSINFTKIETGNIVEGLMDYDDDNYYEFVVEKNSMYGLYTEYEGYKRNTYEDDGNFRPFFIDDFWQIEFGQKYIFEMNPI